jgi:dTDP-glucose pyrophosphorylase
MTLNKFIISDNSKVREALELINEIAIPNMVVFVTNENNQLVGSLTDGDIRRGFLKGFNLDDLVLKLMNINPKYFVSGDNNYDKMNLFKSKYFRFVPVLDSEHKILELIDLENINSLIPADAVLMAGGKGERLKPLTDTIPKPMLKIGDRPIIIRNIERLVSFGISNFHISVRHMAQQIEDGINENKISNAIFNFVKEDKPLGTIGSLKLVKGFSHDTVLLMNSDLLTNIDFKDFYQKFLDSKSDMQVATVTYHVDVPYAVMNINDHEEVLSFSEKPRYTYYSNAGIYIFKKELVELIPDNCAFDATHFMEAVIANNKKLSSYPILGYWLDIGRIEDFYKAQEDVKHIKL